MALEVAFQMDPLEGIDINADSSFALMLEAQARGHRLYHYPVGDLTLDEGRVRARATPVTVAARRGDHARMAAPRTLALDEVDVVMMRQDPPFNMAYITATHLLERLCDRVLVVNDPAAVRNAPEKLAVLDFARFMPPTLIGRDGDAIARFRQRHGEIIVKPLFGNGGAGVFHLAAGDNNLNALLEMFAAHSREPVMVQRYLPEVRAGDKRIILIDGVASGAINRVPPAGEARSNMHVGGRADPASLTARDREICAALGPWLREAGLIFVGIDVIGDYLTEINVTSPTGIQEIARFDGTAQAAMVWDAIEARLGARG